LAFEKYLYIKHEYMTSAPVPHNEQERLKALYQYDILDTIREAEFDDITRIASDICNTPISLVSIVDANRLWFKSTHGIITTETSRQFAFCAHAISQPDDVFVVSDTASDPRFAHTPQVTGDPHIAFYAGVPLMNPEGYALGTLCVWDSKPRHLAPEQIKGLQALARQIVTMLELRRKMRELKEKQAELTRAYNDLDKFASIASHDLKSPLNNIISLTNLLKDGYAGKLEEEANEYIEYISTAANQLSEMVNGILKYSKASRMLTEEMEDVDLNVLVGELTTLLHAPNAAISFIGDTAIIHTSRIALKQILLNLISNAIKHNAGKDIEIKVSLHIAPALYTFNVLDNGKGIPEEDTDRIFELFETGSNNVGNEGASGIGLTIVKRLVGKMGGSIAVHSTPGEGTTFTFSIAR
jgi:signal transduction histidine kinase